MRPDKHPAYEAALLGLWLIMFSVGAVATAAGVVKDDLGLIALGVGNDIGAAVTGWFRWGKRG